MAKRRTKKQKEKAKHTFTLSWNPDQSEIKSEVGVNRQLTKPNKDKQIKSKALRSSDISAESVKLASIKKDIAKSLILASLILASEIVIYLITQA